MKTSLKQAFLLTLTPEVIEDLDTEEKRKRHIHTFLERQHGVDNSSGESPGRPQNQS